MYLRKTTSPPRRGASIIEAVIATILMGSLFAVLLPTMARLHYVSQEVSVKERAVEELRNVVERNLHGVPLTPQQVERIEKSFPEGKLEVIEQPANGVTRVELLLSWDAGEQRPRASARLSYWTPQSEDVQ
ncbi:MAG: hypothetical protein R3C18_03490 [Planctomycetaceae bacterium]